MDLILHKKYGQIRQSLSFHRKKKENKLTQWKNDEKSVRMGNCSFKVKVKIFLRLVNKRRIGF